MTIKTVASYSCAFFCVLIIIISLATNYWHEFELSDHLVKGIVQEFNVGLWERCEEVYYKDEDKTENKGCSSYNPPNFINDYTARRNTVVVMFIFALIATLVAFIFITVYCITGKYFFPVKRSAFLYLFSALVLVIGLSVYTNTFIDASVSFSWSYGAGWSAAAMYIISAILLFADK